eukprot:scaffold918_cov126-Cylindrotheca_fusiformis.AAC.11
MTTDLPLLQHKKICAALGMLPETGCCIRHPDIPIYLGKERHVASCRICEYDYAEAQGRTSSFTLMQSDATPDPRFNPEGGISQDHNGQSETHLIMDSPPGGAVKRLQEDQTEEWMEYTFSIIRRTAQVQRWALMAKNDELSRMRNKLASCSISSSPAPTTLMGNQFGSNRGVFDAAHAAMADRSPPVPCRKPSASANAPVFSELYTMEEADALFGLDLNDLDDLENDDAKNDLSEFSDLAIDEDSSIRGAPSGLTQLMRSSQARVPPVKPMRQMSVEQHLDASNSTGNRHRASSSFSMVSELTTPSSSNGSSATRAERDSDALQFILRKEASTSCFSLVDQQGA